MHEYDDIDLRPYLLTIARRWYWIVVGALLAALLTAGVSAQMPKAYTATSSVLLFIRQTGSQIGVNEPVVRIDTIDINARRQGLLALAQSTAIETQIPPEDLQRVTPAGYTPGMLTSQIEIEDDGDLITISATAPSSEQAQALADIWANTFVSYADMLYTDEHSQVQPAGRALLPTRPSEPKVLRNAIFGGLLGSIAATVIIVVLTILRSAHRQRGGQPALAAGRSANGPTISRVSASQTRGE